MSLSKGLLAIIVCPECKKDVVPTDDGTGLLCNGCRLKFPVREGIPVMLLDEAEKID